MLTTKYISNCTEAHLNDLKTAILFFDKIEIVSNYLVHVKPDKGIGPMKYGDTGVVTGFTHFITDDYKTHISSLIEEGIVSFIDDNRSNKTDLGKKIDSSVNKVFYDNISLIFEESEAEYNKKGRKLASKIKFSDEAKLIHKEFVDTLEIGSKVDLRFLLEYYSSMFSSLISSLATGDQCMTSSNTLNSLFKRYSELPQFAKNMQHIGNQDINANLAFNAISIAVPNISLFPFEEVLETRLRANDELLRFRSELETFQFNLMENYSMQEIQAKAPEIVKHKLAPTLSDLKLKISGMNLKLPGTILSEFKDPKSYLPLITSVLHGMPVHIAVLLSLGLITTSIAYEYVRGNSEIKNNGLYYLIDLNNKFGS